MKFLFAVGRNNNWENCSAKCNKYVDGLEYDDVSCAVSDYCLIIGNVTAREEVPSSVFLDIMGKFSTSQENEIIIFCHEFNGSGHPGTSKNTIATLERSGSIRGKTFTSLSEDEVYLLMIKINNHIFSLKDWLDPPNWAGLQDLLSTKIDVPSEAKIKHRITQLFAAVDMDLQNLWDESRKAKHPFFDQELWKEVVKAYKEMDWEQEFIAIRVLIDEEANKIGKKLQFDNLDRIEQEAIILLNNLQRGNSFIVYDQINKCSGGNPVRMWLIELDDILRTLR